MCIGLTSKKIQDGDKYVLHYLGKTFDYTAKKTPRGIVFVHNSDTPLGYPLGAIPYSESHKYKFERVK